jgi:thioredoxin 1
MFHSVFRTEFVFFLALWIVSCLPCATPFVAKFYPTCTTNCQNLVNEVPVHNRLYSSVKFKDFDHVLNTFHKETLVIYFGTNNCGPCRLMKQELAAARKLIGKNESLKIFSLDTEKWPHLGTRYGIQRLPCILFVREGEIQKRLEGVTKAEVLAEEFRSLQWRKQGNYISSNYWTRMEWSLNFKIKGERMRWSHPNRTKIS